MTNDNVLQGIACPKCNSEGPFNIVATAMFLCVGDDGTGDYENVEWNEESDITCCSCSHNGIVEDFMVEEEEDDLEGGVTIGMGTIGDIFK